MEENFLLDLIASLKKTQSKKQIKEDIKNLGDIKIPLIGTLNKSKTKSQIKQDLSSSSLNGTINLTGKVDSKGIATSVQQATTQAQKQVNSKPVEVAFSVKKEKLLNDIKLLAQQNSRLFKDTDMSIKYNSLLDNAEMARNTVELSNLRTQLGSLRSELKVTGNAGLTMTDALKNGLSKVLQLFGSHGIIVQFTAQLRKAWTEAKELDKSMTDLSRVNAEITRSGFPDYLDRVIDKTKQLAVATKDYIDAVTTFSRAGYNLTDSETLADMAVQLEKVGDMSAVDASKALLAGLQGYGEIDGYGMDQLTEKAQALNDKIDLIGNTASITQAEVARGIQAVGSVMNDANTSIDEFIALLGAGNRAVQDSNKVALAIRTSALRIRGCTAELQEMGEETDNVIESTSTLAEKIKALTNINGSGGVNILEADEETFRSIYDIYNDISKVYDKMSDKDGGALLDLIAGKNRSNQISAILQNMSEANELLEKSLNASGTASAEYEIYLNSAQAATERFGVAMTETYSNIINGETVKGLANAGTAVLDFANSWNILEGTLKGFLTLGILKGVTTLTVAFKNSAVQISNFGTALDSVKKVTNYAQGTVDYAKALNTLKDSCVNLTDAQLKQVLANRNLSDSQLIEILQLENLEVEEQKARLSQLGLTQATVEQTAANGAATASTFSLKAAIMGLGTSIKTAIMSNRITFAIMAISTAIGVTTSAISKYNRQIEETRQKNLESATAASENADKLKDLYNEYTRLASIQDRTTSEEESFKTAVENITVALGNKAKVLEGLTAGTDAYAEALKNATKEELQNQAVDATVGRKSAEEELSKTIFSRWSGSKVSIDSQALSEDAKRAKDIVSETLKEYKTFNDTWDFHFSGDMADAFEYYNALIKAKNELVLAGQDDETLLDTKIYSDLNNVINSMSESMDTYIQKRYEEEKLIYMSQNGIPTTVEEYRNMENALLDVVSASDDLQDKFKEMLMADFTSLATSVEKVGEAVGDAVSKLENTNHLSDQLTTSQEALDKFQSSVKSAYDAYGTLLSGNYSSSDLLDSIQAITQSAKDMGKTINWEFIADMDARGIYDSMKLLGGAIEHISEEYAKSVLSGAGIDVDSKFGQMLANNIIQAQKASTQFDALNTHIDSLQSAYSSLTDIVQSYNKTGYITFDQLQTLLEMEPQYLSCLIDENGQLQLNEAAMTELANQRLNDAEAQAVQQAITELGQLALQDEKTAVNENAEAFTNAVNDLSNYNAELANTIAEATVGASAIRDLNAAISGAESQGATDDQINTVLDNLETKLKLIGNVRDKIAAGGLGSVLKSGSNSGSKNSKDLWKEKYEQELKELEHMHEMELISDEEYWKARIDLNEKYFGESSGMHQKYLEEYQKNEEEILEGIKNLWKDYYSDRKSDLKDLISYAEKLYDKEIDSLEASIKKLEERRDTEKKYWQDQIDDLDAEIEALEAANAERERAINLQEKQMALQRAMHQRVILLYSADKGFYYSRDDKAVRNAKNELESAEHENKIAELKKQQKDLQKQLDVILESYDSQIEAIEKQIDSLKDVKAAWSEIVENQELKELEERLKSIFGDDVKDKILSGNTDFMNSIIAQYSDTSDMLRTIEDATLTDIQNMVAQYGVLPKNLMSVTSAATNIKNALGNVDTSGFNANLDNTAQSSSNAAEKVQNVTTALNDLSKDVSNYQMPEIGGIISEEQTAFNNLKQAVDEVIEAINQKTEAIKEEQNAVGIATSSEMADFLLLKDKILEVKETLESFGTQDEGLISNIATAIESLNDIKLDEGLITQFNNLKEAIDSVTAAISGGNSESSGSKTQGNKSGSEGSESGGRGSQNSAGANSLTGAITEMGNTANEVIGEPDAEGDGTVIGEFGSLETAVNDVTTAIGSGESNGGKSSASDGESDNLIGSITDLGETTDETLGEADGDGVIGRFEEFKDVIGEANEHVHSISDGLNEIDGKEVECTIKVNIETSGGTAFTGSAHVLGSMNLNSAEYNAKYTGNAHYEGTAEVTGDWGVKDGGKTLVGELGQELVVRGSRFFTVGDNGAEFVNLQKGDIVFNHLQTRELLSKGNYVGRGKAVASGTALTNATTHVNSTVNDGVPLYPSQETLDFMKRSKQWEMQMELIANNTYGILSPLHEIKRNTENMISNVSSISNVTNNNKNNIQQPIVNHINVTLPNVTNSTSAESLLRDLESLNTKKYQIDW